MLTLLLATPAWGQGIWRSAACDEQGAVRDRLANKYKESSIAAGVTTTGNLVEVLTSEGGGTWTIIVTLPDGRSCLVGAGEGWRTREWKPEEPRT